MTKNPKSNANVYNLVNLLNSDVQFKKVTKKLTCQTRTSKNRKT